MLFHNRVFPNTKMCSCYGVLYTCIELIANSLFQTCTLVMYNWLNSISDGILYWIDLGSIKGGTLATASDYGQIYSGVTVVHFKVVANYIYAISTNT